MMSYKPIGLSLFLVISIGANCWAGSNIENQIGPFNFAAPLTYESALVSQFGPGYLKKQEVGAKFIAKRHLYHIPNENIWVGVTISHVLNINEEGFIEEVLVTKNKLCSKKFRPKNRFGKFITSKNVKIGNSIDEVTKIYGDPSVRINVENDVKFSAIGEYINPDTGVILRYLPDERADNLLFAEFYFKQDRLHSILISIVE